MTLRQLLKSLTPPIVLEWRRSLLGLGLRFSGQPINWIHACEMSTGYSSAEILDRVISATRKVIGGEGHFERDSVLFDQPEYPYPVLTALLRAAALNQGRLDVLDFGGSLGSTYRQCRPFLHGLSEVSWRVVEQPTFVAAGRREFATPELGFYESISDAPAISAGGIVLASSVLQYLENPIATIEELGRLAARHMVIDRTPLTNSSEHHLCIQHVPVEIYPASYPCWILSRELLLSHLSPSWSVISDYPCSEGSMRTDEGMPFEFRGLILEKGS